MKKLLLSIIVITPLLWAGATWFSSQNTENIVDKILVQSNQQAFEAMPFMTIEKKSFNKGFTQSSAQSTVIIDPRFFGDKEAQPIHIDLDHTIFHGPLMMTPNGIKTGSSYILTTLDKSSLPENIKSVITSLFGNVEPFVSGLTTGVGETINTEFTIAPFSIDTVTLEKLQDKTLGTNKFEFTFSGMSGELTSNIQGTQVTGEMKVGEVKIKMKHDEIDENINFTMAASLMKLDVDEFYKNSILDGKIIMTIPSVLYSDGNGADIVFNDLSISSVAEQEQGLINAHATFDINSVQISSPSIDYAIPDYKLHMNSSINRIERATVIKVVDLEQEVQASQMMMLSGEEPDIAGERFKTSTFAYFRAIGELIKKDVNVNSVIELSSETGDAAINLDLTYIDLKQITELTTVKDLATALQGQLAVTLDKSMIAGSPLEEAIALPIMMGFAVEKEERYESIAKLNAGVLLLNDQAVPFLDMVGNKPLPWNELFEM